MKMTLFLMILIIPNIAGAEVFNVTNGTELQSALTTAQDNDQPDTINLAPGNYDASGGTFTYLADNTAASEENFFLTLIGAGPDQTVLDGGDALQIMRLETRNSLPDDSDADIHVEGMTFQNGNTAVDSGGGLYIVTDGADITVKGCHFIENFADTFGGGADLQADSGDILVNASSFIGNEASSIGGAEFFVDTGSIVATNNIFFDNHAFSGSFGGALIQYQDGGPSGGPLNIINNTITENTADDSGAVAGGLGVLFGLPDEVINIYNNIIFANSTTNATNDGGEDIHVNLMSGEGTTNLFNNDYTQLCFTLTGNVTSCDAMLLPNLNTGGNKDEDPLLVDPFNGDFALAAGSPALDSGDNAAPSLPAADHDGNPRISGGTVDMGALETQVPTPAPTPSPTPAPDGGGCALGTSSDSPTRLWLFLTIAVVSCLFSGKLTKQVP